MSKLNTLTIDEKRSLKKLVPSILKGEVPPEHESKFIELGLAERKLGGLRLTLEGQREASRLPQLL